MVKEININLENDSIDDIKFKLDPLISDYQQYVPIIPVGTQVFRACCRNNEKFYKLSDINYPRPCFVTRNQRANRIGKPIFYASIKPNSSFFETQPEIGSHLVCSTWIINKKPKVNKVGYHPDTLIKLGRRKKLEKWQAVLAPYENEYLTKLFAEAFLIDVSDNPSIYKLSIAISELFIDKNLDGLVYPSVAACGNFDNIVLNTDFVDNFLEFESAEFNRINRIEQNLDGRTLHYTNLDKAIGLDENGFINWEKDNCTFVDSQNKTMMKKYRDENGTIKAKFVKQ